MSCRKFSIEIREGEAMNDGLNDEKRLQVIKKRLGWMTDFAQEIRNSEWDEQSSASQDRYIRIRGESLRAVSLNDLSPLCGFGKSGNAKTVATVLRHFDDVRRTPIRLAEADHQRKKERRLQSHIIKQALLSERNLLGKASLECLSNEFDKLVFALDEVSFGDNNNAPVIRCDLLAVGQIGGETFPVVIELKSNRQLARLDEQLEVAARHVIATYQEARNLLETVTGLKLNSQRVGKILVWPRGDNERAETLEFRRNHQDIKFVEYTPESYGSPQEVTFALKI